MQFWLYKSILHRLGVVQSCDPIPQSQWLISTLPFASQTLSSRFLSFYVTRTLTKAQFNLRYMSAFSMVMGYLKSSVWITRPIISDQSLRACRCSVVSRMLKMGPICHLISNQATHPSSAGRSLFPWRLAWVWRCVCNSMSSIVEV